MGNPGSRVYFDLLAEDRPLATRLELVFGCPEDGIVRIEERASHILRDLDFIVWEGDAQTFQFTYVSRSAERILGYPCERWTRERDFWASIVIHPEDRDEAVAYCALATGLKKDHDFEYRARTADGRTLRLFDAVRVLVGLKGIPVKLRGVMVAKGPDD